ncbi:MAG: EAL domain-containing protein [Myxococcota bacterium]|nr:EAL domain-containing protein [Myxococcota bacterium]
MTKRPSKTSPGSLLIAKLKESVAPWTASRWANADRALDRRLRRLIESSPEPVVMTDAAGQISLLSQSARNLLDRGPDQPRPSDLHLRFHTDCTDPHCPMASAIAARRPAEQQADLIATASETPMAVDWRLEPEFEDTHFLGFSLHWTPSETATNRPSHPNHEWERLKLVADTTPSGIATTDLEGRFEWVNQAFEQATGYAFESLRGQRPGDLLYGAETDPQTLAYIDEQLACGQAFETELLFYPQHNRPFWARIRVGPICSSSEPNPSGSIWTLTNVNSERETEAELRRTQERFRLALAGSRDAIWDWDLLTNHIHYSERWKELLGCVDQNVRNEPEEWFRRIVPRDLSRFKAALEDHVEGRTDHLEFEMEMRRADGDTRLVLCRAAAVRDAHHRATRIAGSLADITDLKMAEADLRRAALHDRLTGLPNRALLVDRIRQALVRSRRDAQYNFALLFFDFDRFKVVNDSLGHRVGDALLVSIARRLRQETRPTDTASRFGGDEFVVLLDQTGGLEEVERTASRFLDVFSEPHEIEGKEVVSTASIGLVSSEMGYTSPDAMLRDADSALYQAKASGRARYCVFDTHMHNSALERLRVESELRVACESNQFQLLYQPVVNLRTGEVDGFEALVRWDHPKKGRLSPDEFIAVAEETGLIIPLGDWVMREAAAQLQQWRLTLPTAQDLFVNVNLSRRQLTHPNLLQDLQEIITDFSIPPGHLKLEITETTVMDERYDTIAVLEKIQALGIPIAMDDFGTGHSSLAFLHRFPIDLLKIDKSFVCNMENNRQPTALVQAIVTLARHLDIPVVAEGIETAGQLEQLQAMQCEYGQGYLFAKPMEAQEITSFLAQNPNWIPG